MSRARTISRDAQAGVTLVEILVVLALLGVITGAVAISLGGVGRGNSVAQEADLLVARLNRAADEIVLTAIPMRFDWREDGYQFQVPQDGADWQPHPIRILGEDHVLPRGQKLANIGEQTTVIVDANLIPDTRKVLILRLSSDSGAGLDVTFDGVNAAIVEGAL